MSKETPPVIVPIKEGEEETRVIVFDADTWQKTGDLKGNESLYLPATVIAERLSDGGEPLLDVRFDDGRISRGHFKSLVKFVSPLPPTVSDSHELKEGLCQNCAYRYSTWFTENSLWNKYAGDYHFLCPTCFAKKAENDGFRTTAWKLVPEST